MAALTVLLQERAFHEIRLEDITHEAGVRVSLFYHYFQSKTDITHEVLSDLLDAFRGEVAGPPEGDNAGAGGHSRAEERRGGKGGVGKVMSRVAADVYNKNN